MIGQFHKFRLLAKPLLTAPGELQIAIFGRLAGRTVKRMLLFFLLPVIAAYISGYRCKRAWISLSPILAMELVYLVCQGMVLFGNYSLVRLASVLQVAFLLSLLVPILKWKLYRTAFAGLGLTVLGTALNRIVIAANSGHMPVYPTLSRYTGYYRDGVLNATAAIDGLHILMTHQTKLNFLADWIDLGFSVMSIGDLMIHAFLVIVVFQTFKAAHAASAA